MKYFIKQAIRLFPFWFLIAIWAVEIISKLYDIDLRWLGVHPRHLSEWYTFLTGAFIHSDFEHIFNNTYPIIITGIFIFFLYGKYSNAAFILSFLLSGLLIFLFARSNTYHVGASGLAYSWAFLLAASGFFRKDRISLALGLLVAMLYGSMIWGIFPLETGVSWDGHLYGALSGIIIAFLFRNINRKNDDKLQKEIENSEEYNKLPEQFRNTGYEYLNRQFFEEE